MIITEFHNLYLECEHIPQCQLHTHSTVVQLLLELHEILERRDKVELVESTLKHSTVINIFGLAVSKYRECKMV